MSLGYSIKRCLVRIALPILNTVMYYFPLGPNGLLYHVLTKFYYNTFNYLYRQKYSGSKFILYDDDTANNTKFKCFHSKNEINNPQHIAKNRRKMKSKSRSFFSKKEAYSYWKYREELLLVPENEGNYVILNNNKCTDVLLLTEQCGLGMDMNKSNLWDFSLIGKPSDVINTASNWFSRNYNLKYEDEEDCIDKLKWYKVNLPHHWQLDGFDVPFYTNSVYPFAFDPPNTRRIGEWTVTECDASIGGPTESKSNLHPNEPGENSTGLYRKWFTLPNTWLDSNDLFKDDSRVFLVFEGVDSCLSVWLNDVYVGYSQDSCLSCEFDVTDIISEWSGKSPDHLLSVMVSRFCDGSYLEDQDKWRLSGIYREVYLIRKPKVFISDIEFKSQVHLGLSHIEAECTLEVSILVEGLSEEMQGISAKVEIWDSLVHHNNPISVLIGELSEGSDFETKLIADGNHGYNSSDIPPIQIANMCTLSTTIKGAKLWSAENPKLYTLVVTLYPSLELAMEKNNDALNEIHTESLRVGFKSINICPLTKSLCINGKRIVFAGVNRNEFNQFKGRSISKADMRNDIKLIKNLNFNSIRSSHYPQHTYWLELCDEYGLYYIDEANIETHGFQMLCQPVGYLSNQLEWTNSMVTRVTRMYERDKNNPCIVMWSLGNESGYGENHVKMYEWLHNRSPDCIVHYESAGAKSNVTDIICPMYERLTWCLEQLKNDSRPLILCEYGHSMCNSGGALHKYWQYFYKEDLYPKFQGGFLWDFVDQALSLAVLQKINKSLLKRNIPLIPNYDTNKIEIDTNVTGKEWLFGGDFNELPHSRHFCCNGILSADREFLPTAFEIKALQCPILIEPIINNFNISLRINNHRSFNNLDDTLFRFTLHVHSPISFFNDTFSSKMLEISCPIIFPGQTNLLDITQEIISLVPTLVNKAKNFQNEYVNLPNYLDGPIKACWIEVSMIQKINSTSSLISILGNEHELRRFTFTDQNLYALLKLENFFIDKFRIQFSNSCVPSNILLSITSDFYILNTQNEKIIKIGRKCGRILSIINQDEEELIDDPFEICLYRAPVDNDFGGLNISYAAQWKSAGYDCLRLVDNKATSVNYSILSDGSIKISVNWLIKPEDENLKNCVKFEYNLTYIIQNDGNIQIDLCLEKNKEIIFPPCYPRVGIKFSLKQNSGNSISWWGKGPHESYIDRRRGVYTGVFKKKVSDMHVHYAKPQENGSIISTKWIKFYDDYNENNIKFGIIFSSSSLNTSDMINNLYAEDKAFHYDYYFEDIRDCSFNVSKYSLSELSSIKHNYSLPSISSSSSTYVHLDAKMMGVGGYDGWSPNVDSEYIIKPNFNEKVYFSFKLVF